MVLVCVDVLIDQKQRQVNEQTSFYLVPNNQMTFERMKTHINTAKFTWGQFYVDAGNRQVFIHQPTQLVLMFFTRGLTVSWTTIKADELLFKEIINYTNEIYDSMKSNSMLVVAFTGRDSFKSSNETFNNEMLQGRCFFFTK